MFRSLLIRAPQSLFRPFSETLPPREQMEYDVLVVGGGPAGLSCAIKLKQRAAAANRELSVCVLEKASEIGQHILSGNVFEPRALDELLPDWRSSEDHPLTQPVTEDSFLFLLNDQLSVPMPVPPAMHNEGNFVISLGALTKWLGQQAESAGVEIFAGFPAKEVLIEDGAVVGVATADQGISKSGQLKDSFTRGVELRAKQTIFAEGARGSLSEIVMERFKLRQNCDPQTFGLGVKEVWEVDPSNSEFRPGRVLHTIGWPFPSDTWAGSFIYCQAPNRVFLGVVVGLDYANPHVSPYNELQKLKLHPRVRALLEGGQCVGYGARALNEGGAQSVPKLSFPGGMLIGCSAGFLNVPKVKGSHTAMKSGMLAAEAISNTIETSSHENSVDALARADISEYEAALKSSWVWDELWSVRNIHPARRKLGFIPWLAYSAIESFITKGRVPWTFRSHHQDWECTEPASSVYCTRRLLRSCHLCSQHSPITYPKPDGKLTFALLDNLARSGVKHEHDQPSHLTIRSGWLLSPCLLLLT